MGGIVRCLEKFSKLSNCKWICTILQYSAKFIECNGDNSFLGEQNGLHSKVCDDFHDTYNGIKRKDSEVITAPPMMDFPPIFE